MDLFNRIWENGLISFDTSSMGRMYEWEYNQAVNIKDAVSYLYQTKRLWESDINIKEFSTQRKLIKDSIYDMKYEKGIFKNLKKRPIPWNKIEGTLGRWEKKGFAEEFVAELLKLKGEKSISNETMDKIEEFATLTSNSPDLESLFDKILIGDGITLTEQEKINAIKRFNNDEICPGCKDKNKNNGNQYNDLFIWELLKKKSKIANKDIIFVTVDVKDDWYYDGKPRKEYVEEFEVETGHKILILTLIEFWKDCKQYLDVSVEDFIELSTIKSQLERLYDDRYQEQICDKINDMIFESEEIKEQLEILVDCCVDMPVLDEIENNKISDIDVLDYDEEYVYIIINLNSDVVFTAQNHTCGEDWSAGDGTISFELQVSGTIPIEWASEDTIRKVLLDKVVVNEIIDIYLIDEGGGFDHLVDEEMDYGEMMDFDFDDEYEDIGEESMFF